MIVSNLEKALSEGAKMAEGGQTALVFRHGAEFRVIGAASNAYEGDLLLSIFFADGARADQIPLPLEAE